MIISTNKSTVVTGLKHGSTMAHYIFAEYINSKDPSIKVTRGDATLVCSQNITKFLVDDYTGVCSYIDTKKHFYDAYYHPSHLQVIDPYSEFFKSLYKENYKPIYFLLRDTYHAYFSAFITDFSTIIREKYKIACQLSPKLEQQKEDNISIALHVNTFLAKPENLKDIEYLISQFCKLFYRELATSPHLSTQVNTYYANILDQISKKYPNAMSNIQLVDLTRYDRNLNNYLTEMKVVKFKQTPVGDKNINTNHSIFDNIVPSLIKFGKNLPLYEMRTSNEGVFYKYIRQAYKSNLVKESHYVDIFQYYG
jgi:hypothetical protein